MERFPGSPSPAGATGERRVRRDHSPGRHQMQAEQERTSEAVRDLQTAAGALGLLLAFAALMLFGFWASPPLRHAASVPKAAGTETEETDRAKREQARVSNERLRRELLREASLPLLIGSLAALCAVPLAWAGRGWPLGLWPSLVLIVLDLAGAGFLWLQYAQMS